MDRCQRLGRDFNEIIITSNMAVIIGKNESEVENGITSYRNRFAELGMNVPSIEKFRRNRLVGTIEEISKQLDRRKNMGIKMINMTVNDKITEEYLGDLLTKYA